MHYTMDNFNSLIVNESNMDSRYILMNNDNIGIIIVNNYINYIKSS